MDMLLTARGISKRFGGVYALRDASLEILPGEVHGLVGENGAGKSTLIKILTGVYSMDAGELVWNGNPARVTGPASSRALGISVIHQDRMLVPSFNAVENAYLGQKYPLKAGKVDWQTMRSRVRKTMEELGIDIDLSLTASRMTPTQKTCLEIVRAVMTECRLLILDEPTASLTDRESEMLFGIIASLKARGASILYVSHRMDEIFRLTDRVTVLRNGENAATLNTAETDRETLIGCMTDGWTGEMREARAGVRGDVLLEVRGLRSRDGRVRDCSFSAHAGEILGIFGLGGSGRTELLETIYGLRAASGGSVLLDGQAVRSASPSRSIRSGMALISEDRRGKGLIPGMSVRENVPLSTLPRFASAGVISDRRTDSAVQESVDSLKIRLASLKQRVIELSGGNQQKVVFSRALMTQPRVFLCDEPTQAVDVRTRHEIHELLRSLADKGGTVVLVTSDLQEMLEVADRIVVISGGRTYEEMDNSGITAQQVLSCCYSHA